MGLGESHLVRAKKELTAAELRALQGYIEALEEIAGSGAREEILSKFDEYWILQFNKASEKLSKVERIFDKHSSTRD